MNVKWWHILLFVFAVSVVALILHPTKFRAGWMYLKSDKEEAAIEELSKVYEKDPSDYRVLSMLAQASEAVGDVQKAEKFYNELLKMRPTEENYKNLAKFYNWTLKPHSEFDAYQKWYEFRIASNASFKDETGQTILNELYGYSLLYRRYDTAVLVLETRLKEDPSLYGDILPDLITMYERMGNKDMVRKYLVRGVEERPDDPKRWAALIDFELAVDGKKSAISWYLKWMATYPNDWELKKNYVKWLISMDDQMLAISFLEDIVSRGVSDPYYNDTLVQLYEWNNVKEKLLPIYLARFEKDPADSENNKKLLALIFDLKKYDTAEEVLKRIIEIYPADKEYSMQLVDVYDLKGNSVAALAVLEKLFKVSGDTSVYKAVGERYLWAGSYEKAKDIFESLLERSIKDPDIYKYLGDIELWEGNNKKAGEYYEEYSKLWPLDYYPHYKLGEIYNSDGKTGKAKAELSKTLELLSSDEKDVEAGIIRARSEGLLGNTKVSDGIYARLMEEHPTDINIVNSRIETLLDTDRSAKAYELAKNYIEKYPDNYELRRNLLRTYIVREKYGMAEKLLATLMNERPEDKSLKVEKANLLRNRGSTFMALGAFEDILIGNPLNEEIRQTYDDVYSETGPFIYGTFGFMRTGGQDIYGPRFNYVHPINSKWAIEGLYELLENTADISGYDPDYSVITNTIEPMVRYTPFKNLKLRLGVAAQLLGGSFSAAPRFDTEWNSAIYGRAGFLFSYNNLFDNPVQGLYFNGRRTNLFIFYDKEFLKRIVFNTRYGSNWYSVDGAKAGLGMGNNFGREDVAGAGILFKILLKPEIRLGYDFGYSKLHVVNDYLPIVPLITDSQRSDIIYGIYNNWNDRFIIDLGGFVGDDPKRDLNLSQMDLYGFNGTAILRLWKNFELRGHYEYSSEDLLNNVGRYQFFDLSFLYRF